MKYVGLDMHKRTIAIAVAEAGKRAEVRDHGEIANTPAALTKLLAKLGGSDVELNVCYEAGPCRYGIQRQVATAGHKCVVVAPSLIPSRPGDRIKTDRRDAVKLARLHRAGELTSVWVPDGAHEAARLDPGSPGCCTQPTPRPAATVRLSASSRSSLSPPHMDTGASSLAIRALLRRRSASYRVGRLHSDDRCCTGAAGPSDG